MNSNKFLHSLKPLLALDAVTVSLLAKLEADAPFHQFARV